MAMSCYDVHRVRCYVDSPVNSSAKSAKSIPRPSTQRLLSNVKPVSRRPHLQQICRSRERFACSAGSAQADDQPMLQTQGSRSWNSKIGAVYQDLLPGPLLFLPSLLQPASTLISLEGAEHGHEWVHCVLSLLPVTQVRQVFDTAQVQAMIEPATSNKAV